MVRLLFPLVAVLALATYSFADNAKDLEKLQGTWIVESVEADGERIPAEFLKDATMTFEKSKLTMAFGPRKIPPS